MPAARALTDDDMRVAALCSHEILDTEGEEVFGELVRLAAELTESPIALISLIDSERQWIKAQHGFDVQAPRELAFCAYAILCPSELLSVPNATLDARFCDNPLVTGGPKIRSYLGIPLVNSEGHALGTLCVIDQSPRAYDGRVKRIMKTLGAAVAVNLELRRALQRVNTIAITDPLTGLLNRHGVMTSLAKTVARGEPVSVIAMDLDHFKEANDAFGHAAGDALLKATAARIKGAMRPCDIVGRVGGDEFVAYLVGVSDPATANGIAERILAAVSAPVDFGDKQLKLGITQGIAIAPTDAGQADILLQLADEALIQAKRRQRGSVGRAAPTDGGRLKRGAAVVLALKDSASGLLPGLTAHLQPLVDLRTGNVCGVEALGRWFHPELGNIAPDEMFVAAGRVGSAHEVSRQVRDIALAAFASLRQDGLAPFRIALNLSAVELVRPDIAGTLERQVKDAGLDMSSIIIEVTEDAVLERVAATTLQRVSSWRGLGAQIALDDFGTGTSGLAQLLRIPLDTIKLDGSFIRKLGTDQKAEKVIEGVVRLGHSMGLTITAEGIERKSEARLLCGMGCDFGQGWLYAKPMDAALLRGWLLDRRSSQEAVLPFRRGSAASA